MKCVKWFNDEGDASFESSTDSESESKPEGRGPAGKDSTDHDGIYRKPIILAAGLHLTLDLSGTGLIVDDIKSSITRATGTSVATTMFTDRTSATAKIKTKKEVRIPGFSQTCF